MYASGYKLCFDQSRKIPETTIKWSKHDIYFNRPKEDGLVDADRNCWDWDRVS